MSKAFWLKLPEPEPTKLFVRLVAVGAGNAAKTSAACAEISAMGIILLANGKRPVPVSGLLPGVFGLKTCPVPVWTVPRYWLKSQNLAYCS